MASFYTSYKISRANEGGYANDARDVGKETYKGVARASHPTWPGWKIIDAYKKAFGPIKTGFIIPNAMLDQLVIDLFHSEYWNKIHGDNLQSQTLANIMFDFSLTSGYTTAIKNLQQALNVKKDGVIGSDTLSKVNSIPEKVISQKVLNINLEYYKKLAANPKYAWAFHSWKSRIDFFQKNRIFGFGLCFFILT